MFSSINWSNFTSNLKSIKKNIRDFFKDICISNPLITIYKSESFNTISISLNTIHKYIKILSKNLWILKNTLIIRKIDRLR